MSAYTFCLLSSSLCFFYVAFNFYLTSVKLVFGDGFSCNCLCSTLLAQFVLKSNPPKRICLRFNEHDECYDHGNVVANNDVFDLHLSQVMSTFVSPWASFL
jgi:hypothetical protein